MKVLNYNLLFKGILFDLIGMATMSIPVVGPFLDLAWAPYAAKKMGEMYPGRNGKIASVLVFIEEILPFTDIIPSFTLMWVYTYLIKTEREVRTIPIRVKN
ncbi:MULTISPECIES: hypothetical protein [unclassified Leeuwenhoekiella]|uniref:hypothetical protein n=1 Tax=unclassified Leeuwenhoekiella TaxID=2615029 RepID=UPI000C46D96D|nr:MULTISPECIES: hypothetical protein [unclassified Leeuwenhoekiella]MAW94931.1 hypothetical protein [Leeuwenhoekiella sp.]MBA79651.1 hypothetical protein [Leeuwenhoekiella sp.]|tara:strand:+ start:8565 stop:8867 length:303 start_codon:yes stop_codon:yes gene_type:complete